MYLLLEITVISSHQGMFEDDGRVWTREESPSGIKIHDARMKIP